MPIPLPVLFGFAVLLALIALLALLFSVASARGIHFHSCGGGADFYCSACPSQFACPATELAGKIETKKGGTL